VSHRFEAFQKSLPCLSPLQATAVPQSIACRHMAPFDGFGRFASGTVQARANVEGIRAGGGHGLDVRLVVIGDHLVGDHSGALHGVAKEGLGTYRVTALP
jgi:hypothetical protein